MQMRDCLSMLIIVNRCMALKRSTYPHVFNKLFFFFERPIGRWCGRNYRGLIKRFQYKSLPPPEHLKKVFYSLKLTKYFTRAQHCNAIISCHSKLSKLLLEGRRGTRTLRQNISSDTYMTYAFQKIRKYFLIPCFVKGKQYFIIMMGDFVKPQIVVVLFMVDFSVVCITYQYEKD